MFARLGQLASSRWIRPHGGFGTSSRHADPAVARFCGAAAALYGAAPPLAWASARNPLFHTESCRAEILNDELEIPPASVDLIYLDPPFNSNSTYNLPFKGKYKNAKPVMAFIDTWEWKEEQDEYLKALRDGNSQKQLLASVVSNVKTMQSIYGGGENPILPPIS